MFEALRTLYPRSLVRLVAPVQRLVEKRLWAKILVGLALGIATGIALGPNVGWLDEKTSSIVGDWLALPGHVFLGVIQMIVVPLVFASIIRGLAASESVDQLRRVGLRIAPYFVVTTTFAVCIGLAVSYALNPGSHVGASQLANVIPPTPEVALTPQASIPISIHDAVQSLLPTNPLGSMVEKQMLQVVLFAICIGIALISLPVEQAQPLLSLLGSLQAVCMAIVGWAMRLAPLAVFGFLARVTASVGLNALVGLGVYVMAVLVGLAILLLAYVAAAWSFAGKSPSSFLRSVREVQLLGFSTSSSAAVMPLSIKVAEEKLGIRPSIAQFVIPLGATINMDGTALYQAAATVFLAQATGVELGLGALALLVITTVGASIGAPSTPGVGIVLLSTVLSHAGIPAQAVALIIGVDRILDMSRTAVNVTGDLTACLVMDRWVGSEQSAQEEHRIQQELELQRSGPADDVLVRSRPSSTEQSLTPNS